MGFKKIAKTEEEFINSARGIEKESEPLAKSKTPKREKTFLMYFTNDEFERVQSSAQALDRKSVV